MDNCIVGFETITHLSVVYLVTVPNIKQTRKNMFYLEWTVAVSGLIDIFVLVDSCRIYQQVNVIVSIDGQYFHLHLNASDG